jgi:hypothetical protein
MMQKLPGAIAAVLSSIILSLTLISTANADSPQYFSISFKGDDVGYEWIDRKSSSGGIVLDYRSVMKIKIAFITVYSEARQYYVMFDNAGKLAYLKSSSDVDGEEHETEICRKKSGVYASQHNGISREINPSEFNLTNFDPLFRVPVEGNWLDLTDAKIEPYVVKVGVKNFNFSNGKDLHEVELSEDGSRKKEVITTPDGTVTFVKKDNQAIPSDVVERFVVANAIKKAKDCLDAAS